MIVHPLSFLKTIQTSKGTNQTASPLLLPRLLRLRRRGPVRLLRLLLTTCYLLLTTYYLLLTTYYSLLTTRYSLLTTTAITTSTTTMPTTTTSSPTPTPTTTNNNGNVPAITTTKRGHSDDDRDINIVLPELASERMRMLIHEDCPVTQCVL